jgi:hypothetical protein
METNEKHIRADAADEEAWKSHATIWIGERLLQKAHEVAEAAEERHRRVMSSGLLGEAYPLRVAESD